MMSAGPSRYRGRPGDAKDPDDILIIRTPDGPRRISRHNLNQMREEEAEEQKFAKRHQKSKASRAARKAQRKRERKSKKKR